MNVRYENLDAYRHEIENNRKAIDIYKDIIDNSSVDIEDDISVFNIKIIYNKISNSNREVRVVRYNSKEGYNIDYINI